PQGPRKRCRAVRRALLPPRRRQRWKRITELRREQRLDVSEKRAAPPIESLGQRQIDELGKALRPREPVPIVARTPPPADGPAEGPRHDVRHALGRSRGLEPEIAGKKLVAPVARQSDGDMLPRELRDEIRRNGRRVAKRTVVMPDEAVHKIDGAGRHVKLG